MDAETWLNANKAIELGFADGLLEDEKSGFNRTMSPMLSAAGGKKFVANRFQITKQNKVHH